MKQAINRHANGYSVHHYFYFLYFLCMVIGCTNEPIYLNPNIDQVGGEVTNLENDMLVAVERPPAQEGEVVNPFASRPQVQSCQLPPPPPLGDLNLVEATAHRFQRPLWYGEHAQLVPWSFVAEQGGRIFAYDEARPTEEPALFFDLTVSRVGNEEGLLGVAFHPTLASQPYLYTYYSSSACASSNAARCSILSRWRISDLGDRERVPSVDRNSELVFMEIPQPYSNHNGGDIRFGHDQYLYISLGDGGSAGDPVNHAQRPETLLGSILRIDVNVSDDRCQKEYSIPPDNPFVQNTCGTSEGGLPEVWAWGLRNSWRMSFDRENGNLWAADVGQNRWEEVNLIENGKNYGWRPVEGPECFVDGCNLNAYQAPVHSYNHDVGRSITGGFVYRGEALPGLRAHYVFSDFETNKVMAFPLENPEERLTLAASNHRFTSFGETLEGELRLLTFDQPSVLKLVSANSNIPAQAFPTRLSETGCYADMASGRLAESVIPYYVNMPFWSDEAEKERAFALPSGSKMSFREAGLGFDMPRDTVLVKTFYLSPNDGPRKRFETRLMHHSERGWVGYTYKWNEAQDEAYLLTGAETETYLGPRGEQTWQFLSQDQCLQCHTAASNRTLGLELSQLNRRISHESGWYEQLTAFAEAGYIDLPQQPSELPSFRSLSRDETSRSADEIQSNDIAKQARAYLHINCAPCHRPGGAPTVELDLRYTTPFNETQLCNVSPLHGDLGIEGAKHLVPGDPEKSLIVVRANRRDEYQMPPVGSHLIDFNGVALLSLWISQLQSCVE